MWKSRNVNEHTIMIKQTENTGPCPSDEELVAEVTLHGAAKHVVVHGRGVGADTG
jgi:hypothetical protein